MKIYQVEVQTGMLDNAGTDAKVYIQLFGEKSNSIEIRLDNKQDNFEKGQLDTFSISTDDLGWIDRVRIFHDNTGKKPGWYLNFVKIKDLSLGLTWKADINRWLAKDEGDKKIDITVDIPVGNVQLTDGILKNIYLGYIKDTFINEGPSNTKMSTKFSYTYHKGVSIDTTKATTTQGGASVEASFFGIGGKFSTEVTKTLTNSLKTTEDETLSFEIEFNYDVQAGQSITPVFLFYQSVLDGKVQAGGITLDYRNKFIVMYQTIILSGVYSDAEVEAYIQELFAKNVQKKSLSNTGILNETPIKVVEPNVIKETIQKIPVGLPPTKPVKAENKIIEISPINTHASFESVKVC